MAFSKILIANRGEIALRIMRSAKALGYRTVAVYSSADAQALHVRAADEAVLIGPPAASQSYLNIDAILAAARSTRADAVHPGYGFLSENHEFARACQAAGLTFIGPDPHAIELMGNKRAAKHAVAKAGVRVVPGFEESEGKSEPLDRLVAEARKIGFPIMVKAAAGGGGRGMRLVLAEADLGQAIASARSEATNAFGSGELILEKAILNGRHIEIQVFGDHHGNVVHLGERDCSVQRRHQKIIEESPSPFPRFDASMRNAMGEAAVNAARACGYVGAGTCEFIVDESGHFYFLEMNTRLQVEHPVTECITGIDLVEWQLRVAAGEPLPLKQEEIRFDGHAIEVRLYAEDPAQGFLPQTGKVLRWLPPQGQGARVDHCVFEGQVVSAFYDPMLAKIIVHAPTRDDARRRLIAALNDTVLLGLNTNKNYLCEILAHPVFAAGGATTAFIDHHMQHIASLSTAPPADEMWVAAALIRTLEGARASALAPDWIGWRSASAIPSTVRLQAHGVRKQADVTALGGDALGRRYEVLLRALDGQFPVGEASRHEVVVAHHEFGRTALVSGGVERALHWAVDGPTLFLDADHGNRIIRDITSDPPARADGAGSGILKSPIDGAVVAVHAAEGDTVKKGQLLLVIEAMKMEHQIKADVAGTIAVFKARKGEQVKVRQLLVEITPAAAE